VSYPFNDHVAILYGVHGAPISLPHAEYPYSSNQRPDADMWCQRVIRDTLQPGMQALRIGARHGGYRLGNVWRDDQRHDAYSLSASKLSSVGNAASFRP
jgi:hypothetical protein